MDAKRMHTYFTIREKLHVLNTSGLYNTGQLHGTTSSAPTLRRYINAWQRLGLIKKNGKHIKLNRLQGTNAKLFRLFCKHREHINAAENPAIYFADLYKKTIIYANVIAQAIKEKEKIKSKAIERKYHRNVTDSKTSVGVKQNIFLSIDTIGRLLGRSKTTAWKYISRMSNKRIIGVQKNLERICCISELTINVKRAWNLYGRLTVKEGIVYERLQNSYFF